jgi:hypothetical protein
MSRSLKSFFSPEWPFPFGMDLIQRTGSPDSSAIRFTRALSYEKMQRSQEVMGSAFLTTNG